MFAWPHKCQRLRILPGNVDFLQHSCRMSHMATAPWRTDNPLRSSNTVYETWAHIKQENNCTGATSTTLKSRAQLEAESPGLSDGLSPADEHHLRKYYCQLILEAGKQLRL